MMRGEHRTVVGIFRNHEQASRSADNLRRASFPGDRIKVASREEGGLLETLQSLFGGGTSSPDNLRRELERMEVPADSARYYARAYDEGRTIVVVQAYERAGEAEDIMRRDEGEFWSGAGMGETTPERGAFDTGVRTDRPGYDTGDQRYADRTRGDREREMELREERLRVDKEQVETGEVTIGKEVVSERQTFDVPVTHEEVVIERHPVEGGRQAAGGDLGEGDEIRIPVREERVDIEKETVVGEELTARREQVEETRRVSEEVRREEPRITRHGDAADRGLGDKDVRDHEHRFVGGRCEICGFREERRGRR
jgi:uncharacterized protein (TIGR02271 family)